MEDKDMMRLATEVLAADPEKLTDAIEKIVKTAEQLDTILSPHPFAGASEAGARAPESPWRGGVISRADSIFGSGGFLERIARRFRPMKSNLDFGGFKLSRFRADDRIELVGVLPANEAKKTRDLYRIEGVRNERSSTFVATLNGRELFTISGPTFARTEKLAVGALHKYVGENKRRHAMRKRARKAKAETNGEGAES